MTDPFSRVLAMFVVIAVDLSVLVEFSRVICCIFSFAGVYCSIMDLGQFVTRLLYAMCTLYHTMHPVLP